MLLFIYSHFGTISVIQVFQYISCYCLSKMGDEQEDSQHNFNTSHVTVYLYSARFMGESGYISIHLMLLFICSPCHASIVALIFQYISCYCLSGGNSPFGMIQRNFNTSHVTVYLFCYILKVIHSWFQYISCYCLSMSLCRLMSP